MNADFHMILHIVGMRNEDDARRAAEELLGVEGVDDSMVDLEARRAEIELNPEEPASIDDLLKAVQNAGFQVESVDKPVFG